MKIVALAATALVISLAAASAVEAKGCVKGAVVGGVAGHFAGHHPVLGAAGGCMVGHHMAHKKDVEAQRAAAAQPPGQPARR